VPGDPNGPSDRDAFERRRRSRNIALAVLLFALVILFYVITILRMGARGG